MKPVAVESCRVYRLYLHVLCGFHETYVCVFVLDFIRLSNVEIGLIYFCLWILISSSKFLKVARDLSRFSIFLFWLSFSEFSPLTALFNLSIYWMKFPFCCVSWASSLSKSPIFLVWSYKIFMLFFNPSMVLTWLFSSLSKSFFSFSIII